MIAALDMDPGEAGRMLAQAWNRTLIEFYGGGPVSIDAVATACTTMFSGYVSLIEDPVERAAYVDRLATDLKAVIAKFAPKPQ